MTQSNSTITLSTAPSSSRNAPASPSNRQGLDRSVSARAQTKTNSPAVSRSNTARETRNTPDRHTPHHQQSPSQQPAQPQPQLQTLPAPTKPKAGINAQPSPTHSPTDVKTHHKPKQAHQTHNKSGTGLNPPGAAPRRREKKDKEDDVEIVKRLQQICTDADPTRLYRNLVKIGAG